MKTVSNTSRIDEDHTLQKRRRTRSQHNRKDKDPFCERSLETFRPGIGFLFRHKLLQSFLDIKLLFLYIGLR